MALQRNLLGCPGYKVYAHMRTLDQSVYIFQRNYAELLAALDSFQRPEAVIVFWAEKNRDKLHSFHVEVSRLLHNFLASVKSLVEQTRILLVQGLYEDNAFKDELTARIKAQFDDSELSHFVQDLRNYILHKGLSMTTAQLQWKKEEPVIDSSIQLDITKLRKWDHWSKPGAKHLNTLGDKAALSEIVQAYAKLVLEFDHWIRERQEDIHKKEFDEMRNLNAEYEKLRLAFLGADEDV
jgi:hypothetical protein